MPMATMTKPMPSASSGMPKVKRGAPELTSVPTRPSSRPNDDHGERMQQRAVRQHDRGDKPEHHQREILGRAELQRDFGERRGEQRDQQRADGAGEERADRRGGQRRAGPALPRHLVAVERGDDGGRFARQVDEDRRGRAAVLRAVVDAGQHDQRRRPAAARR